MPVFDGAMASAVLAWAKVGGYATAGEQVSTAGCANENEMIIGERWPAEVQG